MVNENELMKLIEQQNKYIEEKLRSDKVLEGLLKDIENNLSRIAESQEGQSIRFSDGLAICGALGTKTQPYAPRQSEQCVNEMELITCPECLRIISKKEAAEKKS